MNTYQDLTWMVCVYPKNEDSPIGEEKLDLTIDEMLFEVKVDNKEDLVFCHDLTVKQVQDFIKNGRMKDFGFALNPELHDCYVEPYA